MVKTANIKINQTPEQLAYFAAILDQKGTFYIGEFRQKRNGKVDTYWRSILKVASRDKSFINSLEQVFGGRINFSGTMYHWQVTGPTLDYILNIIHSRLTTKQRQCEIMKRFRLLTDHNTGSKPLEDVVSKKRFLIMKEMKEANSQ